MTHDAPDPVDLLVRLVETPSPSGSEEAVVALIADVLGRGGLAPTVSGRNVWCAVEGRRPGGRTLLLEAHIDTVPPSEAWTSDPYRAERRDGRVQALGANDVKGGAAAMIRTALDLARERDFAGTLVLALTCDEETGGEGLEVLRPELPSPSGAVIAEPTILRACTAQRGLMRVVVRCDGRSAHAARPHQGTNAIELAMRDIAAVNAIDAPTEHPVLGRATLVVTMIEGGVKGNVVPPVCRFTMDVRPTPDHDNDWWERQIRDRVQGEIEVFRGRMTPVATDPADPLVVAALAANGGAGPIGFGGVSDLFHVRDIPGIVLGPGLPEQSHQADEWIEEAEVRRAVEVYTDLCRRYLENVAGEGTQ